MSNTRPSGNSLTSGLRSPVVQEIVQIDIRGRIHLIPRWIKNIKWLAGAGMNDIDALVVMETPGKISIFDWEPEGSKIQKRMEALEESDTEENFDLLRTIQDRYERLIIKKDKRPYLGAAILTHLGIDINRNSKTTAYIVIYPHKFELMSVNYRNKKLLEFDSRLDSFI